MPTAVLMARALLATRVAQLRVQRSREIVSQSRKLRAGRARAGLLPEWAGLAPERTGPAPEETGPVFVPRAPVEPPARFELEGYVGGTPVSATLDSRGLTCDRVLWQHAQVVVALREQFPYGEEGGAIEASLDGSAAQLAVTLMRAMRVTKMRVSLGDLELTGSVPAA